MSVKKLKHPTIGVLVGWQVYEGVLNGFLDAVFRGITAAARDLNCNLLLACGMTRNPNVFHPAWPILTPETDFVPVGPWNTNGLIVINPLLPEARAHEIQGIRASGHPIVFINTGQVGPTVTVDNEGGIRQAIAHLVEHGHRRISFIAGLEGDPGDSQYRLEGYHAAVRDYQLESDPNLIAYGSHTTNGGRLAIQHMLEVGV